jgi:pyruvate formate lyase activating enzyme
MSKGTLLRIEHGSIHDGEGIQTVVFLKGCPLRCLWCSTPESQKMEPEAFGSKSYGRIIDSDDLMVEIMKDSIFFFHSRGGVTVSGGEPLMQPDFVREILMKSHASGIPTTMETSMYGSPETVSSLIEHLDLLYMDIKHLDSDRHREITGVSNERILSNIKLAASAEKGPKIVVRMPVIPTINDNDENMRALGRFCSGLKKLDRIELLPYHRLGITSYETMGLEYALNDIERPSGEYMERKAALVREAAPDLTVTVK